MYSFIKRMKKWHAWGQSWEFRNLETMSPRLYGEMKIVIMVGDRVVGNVFSPSFFLFLVLVFQNDLGTEKK